MIKVAGIDSGSGFTKVVIIEALGDDLPPRVVARAQEKTGADIEQVARRTLDAARKEAGIEWDELSYIAATGFGRYGISFRDIQITEITSGARGTHFLLPQSDAVLDIGSQSTRAVSMKENGRVRTFKTNDKCAAGSGSFIQRAAKYLEIDINDVGELALRAENPQSISSVCAVLAESEIINLVSTGATVEDIMRGIYDSLAHRASLLLKRVGETKELVFIGGVALQRGMVKALQERLERSVVVPPNCTFVCALGAALLGLKRLQSGRTQPTPVRPASLFAGTP